MGWRSCLRRRRGDHWAALAVTKRSGPPVKHVIRALDLTAAACVRGPPSAEAAKLTAKNPVPFMPSCAVTRPTVSKPSDLYSHDPCFGQAAFLDRVPVGIEVGSLTRLNQNACPVAQISVEIPDTLRANLVITSCS